MTKYCGSCETEKPVEAFSKNKARKDGLQNQCRECKGKSQRAYYQRTSEQYRATSYRNKAIRKERNRKFLVEYLLEHPCVDCGEDDVHVLEFDHVRGTKIAGVGKLAGDGEPIEKIKAEIEKCEVRCCNCHRRQTFKRAGVDFTIYV